jgi:CDP-glucose 4,6-dehydratase
MENLGIMNLFGNIYKGKRVLLTGHTGFKGSWLALWLKELGADVFGYALPVSSIPSHYDLLCLDINSHIGDIRNFKELKEHIQKIKPDIVFHLAAQSLVRESYENPIGTYETNVIGTLNVFEACRAVDSVKALINVTTDKVYENLEMEIAYKESDRLGGHDLYSSSKACSEILTSSYRKSFLKDKGYLLSSARAGNVIGGGDWAHERIIPDIVRAAMAGNECIVRNPNSVRPWEHVLEPLSAYLLLGSKLLSEGAVFAEAWNFGPSSTQNHTVGHLVEVASKLWDKISYTQNKSNNVQYHEANLLMLDCTKAKEKLKWHSVWDFEQTVEKTIEWYKAYYERGSIITLNQIEEYVNDAKQHNLNWTA